MYAKGDGGFNDNVEAYPWWNVAAASGNEDACENRHIVEKQMTPSQIEKGQELSNEYYKKYVK